MIRTAASRILRQQQSLSTARRSFFTNSRVLHNKNTQYESEEPTAAEEELFNQMESEASAKKSFKMRATLNKAIICGRVGATPNVKLGSEATADAPAKKGFGLVNLATSDTYLKDANGKNAVTWHAIITFHPNILSILNKYVRKGMLVYAEGPIIYRQSKDKDGNPRTVTQILVREPSDFRVLDGEVSLDQDK